VPCPLIIALLQMAAPTRTHTNLAMGNEDMEAIDEKFERKYVKWHRSVDYTKLMAPHKAGLATGPGCLALFAESWEEASKSLPDISGCVRWVPEKDYEKQGLGVVSSFQQQHGHSEANSGYILLAVNVAVQPGSRVAMTLVGRGLGLVREGGDTIIFMDGKLHQPTCGFDSCEKLSSKTCGGCSMIKYCSKECQTQHWSEHKKTCLVSRRVSS
jgi:hypothetical protein